MRRPTLVEENGIVVRVTTLSSGQLSVKLRNVTKSPIIMDEGDLPWKWRYSMWIKAFEDDAIGSSLEERLPIADPPVIKKPIILAPGLEVQGAIDLSRRFPELENLLTHQNVIIFWSYSPVLKGSNKKPHFFGSLMIPRTTRDSKLNTPSVETVTIDSP